MVDHLQTKWFFNRGLDSKVCWSNDNFYFLFIQIPEEYPDDLQGEIFYHLYRELLDLPLFDCLSFSCRYLGPFARPPKKELISLDPGSTLGLG